MNWPLYDLRWAETQYALGPLLKGAQLSWEIAPYPHFDTPRGYAVTFLRGDRTCKLRFSDKIFKAPGHRIDGVLRHELGHVVDMSVPAPKLNEWAKRRHVRLPSTIERRADAVAEAIWGSPIYYDSDLVQSTSTGVCPRPVHLGL